MWVVSWETWIGSLARRSVAPLNGEGGLFMGQGTVASVAPDLSPVGGASEQGSLTSRWRL